MKTSMIVALCLAAAAYAQDLCGDCDNLGQLVVCSPAWRGAIAGCMADPCNRTFPGDLIAVCAAAASSSSAAATSAPSVAAEASSSAATADSGGGTSRIGSATATSTITSTSTSTSDAIRYQLGGFAALIAAAAAAGYVVL